MSASTLLRAGWAVGATVFLIPLAGALFRLRRVRRAGLPWLSGQTLARGLAIDAGVGRRVDVLLHEDIPAPMTCGVVRPLIAVPPDAAAWTESDVRRAIVHELEHVHRLDWPVHLLARVVCSVYWFHPLVWRAWRQLCLESERACDDAVLRGADRTVYAEQLVSLARRLVKHDARPMLSMASRTDLSARIAAVLDRSQPRGRVGFAQTVAIMAAATVFALAISPLGAASSGDAPSAQESAAPATSSPAFEVASIKPNKSGETRNELDLPGERFVARNVPLRDLILLGFGVRDVQLVGGPGWIASDRFDIEAKANVVLTPNSVGPYLQQLLMDRFSLKVHNETREMPIYALVVARRDGSLGPQLRRQTRDFCAEAVARQQRGQPPEARQPGQPGGCAMRGGPGTLTVRSMPMASLAGRLTGLVDRFVMDRTDLDGVFDLDLAWMPEQAVASADSSGPSIFTALQEQLGLRLEATSGPVEVLVIDQVERPTDDAALRDSPASTERVDAVLNPEGETRETARPSTMSERAASRSSADQAGAGQAQIPRQVSVTQLSAATADSPAFEVASIKPNKSGETDNVFRLFPSGGFGATNAPLKELIRVAYQLQTFQIDGAPSWIDSARFDIEAKPEPGAQTSPVDGVASQMLMLRTLLADRFNLRVHKENRELPIYALVLARPDGKFGPQLGLTAGGCKALVAERAGSGPPAPPGAAYRCGLRRSAGVITGGDAGMRQLANGLAPLVGRLVIDQTGLIDNFDFDLSWTPDQLAPNPAGLPEPTRTESIGPSIFVALQEQLGLKLEATRGPVEVLVIDSVEQPTPD